MVNRQTQASLRRTRNLSRKHQIKATLPQVKENQNDALICLDHMGMVVFLLGTSQLN